MKLADSHIHLFRHGYPGCYGALFPAGDLAVYEAMRKAHDIERALVVGYEGDPWSRGNNAYIARLAASRPWIVPLAYRDARQPLTRGLLAARWKQGFAGLSLYIASREEADMLLKTSAEAIGCLNEHRAILSLNCPPGIATCLSPFFERLGETRVLLSHLAMPGKMEGALRRLRPVLALSQLPHLGVKISGAYACNRYPHAGLVDVVDGLREAFGEARLYWGSDFCPALDSVTFAQTIDLGQITGFLDRKILGQNLQAVIRRVRPGLPE